MPSPSSVRSPVETIGRPVSVTVPVPEALRSRVTAISPTSFTSVPPASNATAPFSSTALSVPSQLPGSEKVLPSPAPVHTRSTGSYAYFFPLPFGTALKCALRVESAVSAACGVPNTSFLEVVRNTFPSVPGTPTNFTCAATFGTEVPISL